jgi:hypothetical protein
MEAGTENIFHPIPFVAAALDLPLSICDFWWQGFVKLGVPSPRADL